MNPLFVLILSAIALLVTTGVAHHFGAGELIASIETQLSERGGTLANHIRKWWLESGVVMAKKLAYIPFGLLVFGEVVAIALTVTGQAAWWFPFITLLVAVLCSVWLYRHWHSLRAQFSPFGLVNAAFWSMAMMGIAIFMCGLSMHSTSVTLLGVVFLRFARSILFWAVKFAVWAATKGIELLEGSSSLIANLTRELLQTSQEGLMKLISVNVAEEQDFEPARKRWEARVTLETDALMLLGVLFPSYAAVAVLGVISGMLYNTHWQQLNAVGLYEKAEKYQKSSTLWFLRFVTALYVLVVIKVFIPGLADGIDRLIHSKEAALWAGLFGADVAPSTSGQVVHHAGSLESVADTVGLILSYPTILIAIIVLVIGVYFARKSEKTNRVAVTVSCLAGLFLLLMTGVVMVKNDKISKERELFAGLSQYVPHVGDFNPMPKEAKPVSPVATVPMPVQVSKPATAPSKSKESDDEVEDTPPPARSPGWDVICERNPNLEPCKMK